jgi:DNA-binding NarL/FixJ family response regulator
MGTAPAKSQPARTVLIVDDNAAIRKVVASSFQQAGFHICGEAANGKAAVESVTKVRPDIIVLDLSMPEMDGLKAAPELKKISPSTAIILFTFFANDLASTPAAKLSVDLVFPKTAPFNELVEKAELLIKR